MKPQFDYGQAVRVVRNVRNDGTFPGQATGTLLIRRGAVGYVRNVGVFLQDQLIYEVHFLDGDRLVGCREEELVDAGEPWRDSRFETRELVQSNRDLAVGGEIVASRGEQGQVMQVLRDGDGPVCYHVRFPGRTLQVPEGVLEPAVGWVS